VPDSGLTHDDAADKTALSQMPGSVTVGVDEMGIDVVSIKIGAVLSTRFASNGSTMEIGPTVFRGERRGAFTR
jgi:hypothetical protein